METATLPRLGTSAHEGKDEQLMLMGSLLKTVHHFFGGFSPSVLPGDTTWSTRTLKT